MAHPIGLANTAIGGQRIEEYMSNSSIATCGNRTGAGPYDATLFGQHSHRQLSHEVTVLIQTCSKIHTIVRLHILLRAFE